MPTTLTRWRDNLFAPFEASAGFFPFVAPEIRIEQVVEDGHYVVRAEIPGVDPQHDIDVSVESGVLSIRAERTEKQHDKAHSEFHYGKLVRSVPLPGAVKGGSATATYDNGILEISFTIPEPKEAARHIKIEVGKQSVKEMGAKAKK